MLICALPLHCAEGCIGGQATEQGTFTARTQRQPGTIFGHTGTARMDEKMALKPLGFRAGDAVELGYCAS